MQHNLLRQFTVLLAAGSSALWFSGCGGSEGPELGNVYGTVTLDGEPLAEASVVFQPTESGRLAVAMTDENGEYVLQYSQTSEGAILGEHVVRITTGQEGSDDGEEVIPTVPERVPVRYNRDALDNPEMNVEIKTGTNQFDFELTSDGEIVQPLSTKP